jgi:hypothetical protein
VVYVEAMHGSIAGCALHACINNSLRSEEGRSTVDGAASRQARRQAGPAGDAEIRIA